MSGFADILSGQQPGGLGAILAQLNQLLTPTEKLPDGQRDPNAILTLAPPTKAAGAPSGVTSGSPGSSGSTLSSLLKSALTPNSPVSKIVQSLMGSPISAADAATWASGAPANSAVSSALGSVGTQTAPESAAIQAANDAALASNAAGGLGSFAGIASGAPADAAVASQLGNVADDGTAAAVQGANDAALSATDGGAAGAGAGAGSGALGMAGKALGGLGSAYSLYNEIKNYQSGNTGSDAMSGAETGASIGTMVLPGIGTLIGGALGAVGGAIASAFGGGEEDPETATWNKVAQNPSAISSQTPSQLYQNLAGVMDAKDNSAGHSQPIEQAFGREGEGNLMDQLTGYLNQQYQGGNIKPGESIADQWSQTVAPWLASKNASIANQNTASGTPEGPALTSDLQGLIGDWESGQFTGSTPMGINGQTIGGLANYLGLSPTQLSTLNPQPTQSPVARALSAAAYQRFL